MTPKKKMMHDKKKLYRNVQGHYYEARTKKRALITTTLFPLERTPSSINARSETKVF
jgi:hypothetical protein